MESLSSADIARFAWMRLHRIGPKTILKSFDDEWPDSVDSETLLAHYARSFNYADRQLALEEAYKIVRDSHNIGIRILSFADHEYPGPLKDIPDPPPFLHILGELPSSWSHAVAVVGTREPTSESIEATQATVDAFGSASDSSVIVSGLALGIDSVAHNQALTSKVVTVAVLANGLDTVYPRDNGDLARRIVDRGGCLISETPLGVGVSRYGLVARDRLQSGLSRATFVMQSGIDGGSMHTALFTLQQNRKLFAYRPTVRSSQWGGNWFLLAVLPNEGFESAKGTALRFARYPIPHAYGMSRSKISAFVHAAMKSDFTPRSGSSKPHTLKLL